MVECIVLFIMGWFCWMSIILVNEKKERHRENKNKKN